MQLTHTFSAMRGSDALFPNDFGKEDLFVRVFSGLIYFIYKITDNLKPEYKLKGIFITVFT